MVLEICPSADIHLALISPFNTVTLRAVRHDELGSHDVQPGTLSFEMDRRDPVDGVLDNGDIKLDIATGVVTALGSSSLTFVRVTCEQEIDGSVVPFSVPVRIVVHDAFPEVWIGNTAGRVMAGTDNFVPTIFAESKDGVAVDITGHGFVRLSLDAPVDGCSVDEQSGRVTAGLGSAGETLLVNVDLSGTQKGQLPVLVTPAREEQPDESAAVTAMRQLVEELPFEPSEVTPRRNILLVAEGFAHRDEHEFRSFALKIARRLRKRRVHEPFRLLRDDYRIWMAFAESEQSGVTITTRVHQDSGELKEVSELEASMRLLQVHDTPFGLAYGRRAGDVSFSPVAPPPPEEGSTEQSVEVVRTPEEDWKQIPREPRQMIKDWRRLGRNRSMWNASSIEWLLSLRKKGAASNVQHYRIGETWGPGGPDQGLVLVIGNAEFNAGRYEPGDPDHDYGYLFGTVSLGQEKTVTVRNDAPRFENVKSTRFGSGGYNAKMARTLTAIHELAHGIFLGDEYEDIHDLHETDQRTAFNYDNVDAGDWIEIEGRTKWSTVPRVSQSTTLVDDAVVEANTPGRIEVVLQPGEGARWTINPDVPVAALQTRNINQSSAHLDFFRRYPAFRAHKPAQVPRLFVPITAEPPEQPKLLCVIAVDGDRITLTGDALVPGTFPAGSLLFAPKLGPGDVPLSLVLPGVIAYMHPQKPPTPLSSKGGVCAKPVEDRVTFPSVDAATLGIQPPPRYQQVIGLYEGGGGFNCGVYRPTGECMMRNQLEIVKLESTDRYIEVHKIPFCHVCRYVIVQEFNPSRHAELDQLYPGRPFM